MQHLWGILANIACDGWIKYTTMCAFGTAVAIGGDMVSTPVKYVQQNILHRHAAVCLYVQVCIPPACTQILAPVFNITVAFQHGVNILVCLTEGLGKCNLVVLNAITRNKTDTE